MIIKLTKADVVKALEEEKFLEAGSWISLASDKIHDRTFMLSQLPTGCGVCAVGAVMRRVLSPDQPVRALWDAIETDTEGASVTPDTESSDYIGEAEHLLAQGHYLAGLSVFFEGAWRDGEHQYTEAEIRALMTDWVNENFPDAFEVDINGALPLPHIEVVVPRWLDSSEQG
jgi:hypothetical protein